jgi:acyl transferase domain-containing protein
MTKMKSVFIFPGQGAQYYQMGKSLFDQEPVFRQTMTRLDASARRHLGYSAIDALYDPASPKTRVFDDLPLSSASLFMVEYAIAETLIAAGVKPDLTLGASMGTFAAAAVAGCLAPEHALDAICELARLVTSRCQPGAMIAILADRALLQDPLLRERCVVASDNMPNHCIASLPARHIDAVEATLRTRGISFQRLPVNYAFHSPWVDEAEQALGAALRALPLRRGAIPVVCCAQAGRLEEMTGDHWWPIVRQPIRFQETIRRLEMEDQYRYIDAGPSPTMSTFLKYLLPADAAARLWPTMTPFGHDVRNLNALRAAGAALAV